MLARSQEDPAWEFPGLAEIPVHGMEVARRSDYDIVVRPRNRAI